MLIKIMLIKNSSVRMCKTSTPITNHVHIFHFFRPHPLREITIILTTTIRGSPASRPWRPLLRLLQRPPTTRQRPMGAMSMRPLLVLSETHQGHYSYPQEVRIHLLSCNMYLQPTTAISGKSGQTLFVL